MAFVQVPYFDIMKRWIYEGVLDDPYHEFMVAENKSISKDAMAEDLSKSNEYWDGRYAVLEKHVAWFLSRCKGTLLTTGKYLNVVRECGREIRCPDSDSLGAHILSDGSLHNDGTYEELVGRAFHFASSTVLGILITENKLVERLRSLKHYFLLDQGDLYVNFMDLAKEVYSPP
jgi:gamma-tubulin complex component 2